MSEGSREVRKTGSPKEVEVKGERAKAKGDLNSKVEGPESEEENTSAPDSYRDDTPHSEIKELTTQNLPPTTKMEVHHHPNVEKKNFKEYLLEGIMIFVAVTMGFFAESLREHINEHSRAEEFAVTLYSDLKADTADLNGYIAYTKTAAGNVDTLMHLLSDADSRQVPSGKLYWFGLWGGAYRVFIPHDATLLEMKSSGSLRYFANASINRKLAQYDQLCQNMKITENATVGVYTEVRKYRAQLFNFKYNAITNDISRIKDPALRKARIDSFIRTNPPLLSYDKVIFNQYVEMARSRFLDRKVTMADTILNNANNLIAALKKEYKLEE